MEVCARAWAPFTDYVTGSELWTERDADWKDCPMPQRPVSDAVARHKCCKWQMANTMFKILLWTEPYLHESKPSFTLSSRLGKAHRRRRSCEVRKIIFLIQFEFRVDLFESCVCMRCGKWLDGRGRARERDSTAALRSLALLCSHITHVFHIDRREKAGKNVIFLSRKIGKNIVDWKIGISQFSPAHYRYIIAFTAVGTSNWFQIRFMKKECVFMIKWICICIKLAFHGSQFLWWYTNITKNAVIGRFISN